MTHLHQIIAVEKGIKARTDRRITDFFHALQKPQLFTGLARTYVPKDEEGDRLPGESQKVQLKADDVLRAIFGAMAEQIDLALTKDVANTRAFADVKVDGHTILEQVPATFLLVLEKRLVDVQTALSKVPVLDPSVTWLYDPAVGVYRSEPEQTSRSKKVKRNHVKAPATDRHPAQVEVYDEDVMVGTWTKTVFSGAFPQEILGLMQTRVGRLLDSVRAARTEANQVEASAQEAGAALFAYIMEPVTGMRS